MDAITNLLTRNSPRELTTPIPSKDEMHEIYQAALRAPDHAWLRPSRFIEVTGAGLDKLSKIFIEFAANELKDVTPLQMEKYQAAPFRAPMIIILATQISEHPKVPKVEQMLSTAAAAENILLGIACKKLCWNLENWKIRINKKIAMYLNLPSDHEIVGYLYVGTPRVPVKKYQSLMSANLLLAGINKYIFFLNFSQ
jgi:nitroreductase